MIKLYYNPQSRASITKWMLDECGAEYILEPIDFKKEENKTPAFLALNPSGKLPVIVEGEQILFESSAIGIYLGDRFPQANLAPALDSPMRGKYLTLAVYATSQLEPAMGDLFLKQEASSARGWTAFEQAQSLVEQALGEGPYLLGEHFTMADILVGSVFIWRRLFGQTDELPAIKAYIDRLLARPYAIPMPD